MANAPNNDGSMNIRWRPLTVMFPYAFAFVFSALTVALSLLIASGDPDLEVAAAFLLLAIPLTGFAAFMCWAEAFRRSRSPYLVVDFTAGTITSISTFGRRHTVRLRAEERFAIEYGEQGSDENLITGDRVVVVRADGYRFPTQLWKRVAHRGDWAEFSRRLEPPGRAGGRSSPVRRDLGRDRRRAGGSPAPVHARAHDGRCAG